VRFSPCPPSSADASVSVNHVLLYNSSIYYTTLDNTVRMANKYQSDKPPIASSNAKQETSSLPVPEHPRTNHRPTTRPTLN
jgi:hypothetical protein